MKRLGIIENDFQRVEIESKQASWNSLSSNHRKISARKMELYAALIENMDQHISRLFNYLKTTEQYENTMIIFLSDNGPSSTQFNGNNIQALSGKSLIPIFKDNNNFIHSKNESFAWEVLGRKAIRQSNWKMLWSPSPIGNGKWQLYEIAADPGEFTELFKPEVSSKLKTLWEQYTDDVGVITPVFKSIQ